MLWTPDAWASGRVKREEASLCRDTASRIADRLAYRVNPAVSGV